MFFSRSGASDARALLATLQASQAVIEFAPDGRILTANGNFLGAVGYTLAEIQGRSHSLFCEDGYAKSDAYRRFWQDLAAGQFQSGEFKRVAKGGRVLWLQASYNPVRDNSGRITRIVKFASDITATKLKSMDDRGKIDAIERAQAVIEFGTDGTVLTANGNFLKVTGYSLAEIAGKSHRMFCDPAYAASSDYGRFWNDLRAGKLQAGEFRRFGKGGREIYIQANYNPILDDAGAVVKIVKFATDVTESARRRLRNERLSHTIHQDLGDVVRQVNAAAGMATSANDASDNTGGVINSVAAAAEELSQSVRDISHSMTYARTGVEDVFRHAEGANSRAGQLTQSAAAMTNVVTLIQDIAGQINLLALNATIESARAGDAGKGFAVVASEVKNLANQAANSTKTIAAEIATMQAVSTEVVEALTLISGSMNTVLDNVASVAGAIEQQNAVTSEITHNMHSAVSSVGQIQGSLGRIRETFGVVAEASERVKQDVETLVA